MKCFEKDMMAEDKKCAEKPAKKKKTANQVFLLKVHVHVF